MSMCIAVVGICYHIDVRRQKRNRLVRGPAFGRSICRLADIKAIVEQHQRDCKSLLLLDILLSQKLAQKLAVAVEVVVVVVRQPTMD